MFIDVCMDVQREWTNVKYRMAKKVMADRDRVLRRLADVEKRRTERAADWEKLATADAEVERARVLAREAEEARETLKRRHAEEMDAETVKVYETSFAADQLAAHAEAQNQAFKAAKVALDAEEQIARGDLAKIEKLVPDAEARLSKSVKAPCATCNDTEVVPIFCADPKHARDNPVKGAGEPHECKVGVGPCAACAPVAAAVVVAGTGRVNPNRLITRGSTPRHAHLVLRGKGKSMGKVANKTTR